MAKQTITEYGAPPQTDPAGNRMNEAKQPEPETLVPRKNDETEDKALQAKERDRRRYIKRTGGFRKDLNETDIALGRKLCDELNAPPESGWLPIHIPGYDNANHQANERKPDAVEALTGAVDKLTRRGAPPLPPPPAEAEENIGDEAICPYCEAVMVPQVVKVGPNKGMPKCTECGRIMRDED